MKVEEALKHFPIAPSPELIKYTNEVAMSDTHHLFVNRVKKDVYKVFCTHCKEDTQVNGILAHNKPSTCPNCNLRAIVKKAGLGRKTLVYKSYVEFAERSVIDPQTITISRYHVVKDYNGDYRNIEMTFHRLAMYVFKQGEAHMYSRTLWDDEFNKKRTVYSIKAPSVFGFQTPTYFSREQLLNVIQGTPFQYSMVEQYDYDFIISYLALYCKYPFVEALTKIGLQRIIERRLTNNSTLSINWRGKTLDKIIGLPKRDWKHFRLVDNTITEKDLLTFKQLRTVDVTMPALELMQVVSDLGVYSERFIDILEMTSITLRKAINYCYKQMEKDPLHFNYLNRVIVTWKDYLTECVDSNIDLTRISNVFPADLYGLHQEQIARRKIILDVQNDLKAKERYEQLQELMFADERFIIRPFMSAQEIINEGNQLEHCIGNYVTNHVKGNVDLFTIRLVDAPDIPYYSAEIKNGYIMQVRGLKNKSAPKELDEFMETFKNEVLVNRDTIINNAS